MTARICSHLICSPFQEKITQDLLTKDPTFISHLIFSEEPYMMKYALYLLEKTNPTLFKNTSSPVQQHIVNHLFAKEAAAYLEDFALKVRND